MSKLFDGWYDSVLCTHLIREYYNGSRTKDILNEILYQFGALTTLVTKSEIGSGIGPHNMEVLKVEALERLYEQLEKNKIPDTALVDSQMFHHYIWVAVRNTMMNSLNRTLAIDICDFGSDCFVEDLAFMYGRLPSHNETESRIYLLQFQKILYKAVINDIRFNGKEKKACIFITACLLKEQDFKPEIVLFRYDLSTYKYEFLYKYVEVLIKINKIALLKYERDLEF